MRIHFIWRSVQRAQPKSPQATAPPSLIGRSARCGVDSIQRLQRAEPRFTFLLLEILWSVPFHRFRFSMTAAAQLHGSAATAAAYRRTRAYSVPSSCRVLWSPLVGYPKV